MVTKMVMASSPRSMSLLCITSCWAIEAMQNWVAPDFLKMKMEKILSLIA